MRGLDIVGQTYQPLADTSLPRYAFACHGAEERDMQVLFDGVLARLPGCA